MSFILGIDQGGTSTRAAVMDLAGNLLGYGRTKGIYYPREGMKAAMHVISEAVGIALGGAAATMKDVDMIVAGISGIDWEGDDIYVAGELKKEFGIEDVYACNDGEIAYYSGSVSEAGGLLCAGTGANAVFFAPDGSKFVMSDYMKSSLQGGSAIARRAIEAVFESKIGMYPETKLENMFLGHFGDSNAHELLYRAMMNPAFHSELTKTVPKILMTADEGDEVAISVLRSFSDDICANFLAGMKTMDMLDLACDVVLAGSVLKGEKNMLTAMITERLAKGAKNAAIINAKLDPIAGACILGVIKKTGSFSVEMQQRALDTAEQFGLIR